MGRSGNDGDNNNGNNCENDDDGNNGKDDNEEEESEDVSKLRDELAVLNTNVKGLEDELEDELDVRKNTILGATS